MWRFGTVLMPFLFPLVFWIIPCAPHFLYSITSECKYSHTKTTIYVKIIFYFVEGLLFSPVVGIAGFLCVIIMVPVIVLSDFLHKIHRRDDLQNYNFRSEPAPLFYRQAQILITLYNECVKEIIFPVLFIIHAGVIIMSLFVILELRNKLHFMAFILYPFLLIMIIGFDVCMMEFCSKPFSLSKLIKWRWQKLQYHQKNVWLQRFARSCPILKIYTSPTLPVDRMRLTIFMRFCLQRTLFLVVYHRRI